MILVICSTNIMGKIFNSRSAISRLSRKSPLENKVIKKPQKYELVAIRLLKFVYKFSKYFYW